MVNKEFGLNSVAQSQRRIKPFSTRTQKPFLPLLSVAALLLLYCRCNFQIQRFYQRNGVVFAPVPRLLRRRKTVFAKPSAPSFSATFGNRRTVRMLTVFASSEQATETKKQAGRGIMKPRRVSPEMQAFLGGVSRFLALKCLRRFGRTSKRITFRYVYEL